MKILHKRTVSFLLVVCLMLTAMIPAVSAVDDGVLNYTFNFDETATSNKGNLLASGAEFKTDEANPYNGEQTSSGYMFSDGKSYYLNCSGNRPFLQYSSGFRYKFVAASETNGDWFAIKISGMEIGSTYELKLKVGQFSNGGKFEVYVVDNTTYSDLIKTGNYKLGSATADTNSKFFTDIKGAVLNDVTTVDSSDGDNFKAYWNLGNVTFDQNDDYVLIFKCIGGVKREVLLLGLTMTPVVEAMIGDTSYATVGDAIKEAKSGDEIDLQADVQTGEIVLPAGVTLDLNGKTLTATVDARDGILTDSSNGSGKLANTAVFDEVGSNEVALVDGNYFRIFDYALEEVETVKNGDTVHFWFNVTLSDDAYTLIAKEDNDSKFNVGATLQWNDNTPVTVDKYETDMSIKTWADLMLDTPSYSFYVKVVGLSNAAESGTLKAMPTVSGVVGGGSLANAMSCTIEAAQ